jgi:type IV pilus assembly protein PilA
MKINKKGFTMIEVMIVLAIIGILAAIAIPQFVAYKHKKDGCPATMSQSISDITNVEIDKEKETVIIHTTGATFFFSPVDFSKSPKIPHNHVSVYHIRSTPYCQEAYYFKGDE